ncbi:MAG: Y-family DNA polymerase [Polyangiaceae bacterium]
MAVVVSRLGGSVQSERDVLGNTRLDVVSPEAMAQGVRVGQTVAAARAKCSELRVKVVGEGAVRGLLVRVAESMLVFGPVVSFDSNDDVVWVDVTGCAHLHGDEERLVQAMGASVVGQGHACRVAVADGPRVASAVARFASSGWVVPEGQGAAAMRVLPTLALGLDEETDAWLFDLGLRRCGDLQKLPRPAFASRLGARAHEVMRLLDGDDPSPLVPWRPAAAPEESIDLEWGAHSIEALGFVMHTLCDRLALRLEGRAMAAGRLEVDLQLDRALCEGVEPLSSVTIVLPVPVRSGSDLFAVVRARLERHAFTSSVEAPAPTLAAPVVRATLRAGDLVARAGASRDLFSPEPKAERALPSLVAELAAEIGAERVGTLGLVDTWHPCKRTCLVPFGTHVPPRATFHPLETSALEPTRLVPCERVKRSKLLEPRLLSRIEAVEWWSRSEPPRDLVAAWWSGGLGWFEVPSTGEESEPAQLRGWID